MSYLDYQRVAVAGLEAAIADESVPGQATGELNLGLWYVMQDRYPLAIKHCKRALILARKASWPEAEASALNYPAAVHWTAGTLKGALRRMRRSLQIDRSLGQVQGQPATQAVKLANLGLILCRVGQAGRRPRAPGRSARP